MTINERLGKDDAERNRVRNEMARRAVPLFYRKIYGTSFAEGFIADAFRNSSSIRGLLGYYNRYKFEGREVRKRPRYHRVREAL